MFCALNADNQRVNLLEETADLLQAPFHCPACGSEVRLKHGKVKSPHFAHLSLKKCQAWSENESAQHLALKQAIYNWAKQSNKVEMEYYLPALQQTPDLLINDKLAIEIQCSRLSLKRLRERTENYRRQGYRVFWMMGRDLWLGQTLSPLQKDLLYFSRNLGFYYWECDLQKRLIRLKYLIHENLKGQLAYLSEEYPFEKGDFLEVLRRPFKSQKTCQMRLKSLPDLKVYLQKQLHYQVPKWMQIQADYYLHGKNLLEETFPVHWAPLGLNLLSDDYDEDFCQISHGLSDYYENYLKFYQKAKKSQESDLVYSPAYYLRK